MVMGDWDGRRRRKSSRFRKKSLQNHRNNRLPSPKLALRRAIRRIGTMQKRRRRRSTRTNMIANRRTKEPCSPCAIAPSSLRKYGNPPFVVND